MRVRVQLCISSMKRRAREVGRKERVEMRGILSGGGEVESARCVWGGS